jgi:uncharacterized phage infection (PIP) family protein YhgE
LDHITTKVKEALTAKIPELDESFRQIIENNKKIKETREGIAEARAMQASADKGLQEVAKVRENIAKVRENIAKERQNILTKQFYSIFNGKKELPVDEIDALFNTLADGSLTVEKNAEGKSYPKINSMTGVTHYLTDHPNVKICDFRIFQNAINEIPIFAEFLEHSTVKLVGFKNNISEKDKASLDKAKAARNGELKVQISA